MLLKCRYLIFQKLFCFIFLAAIIYFIVLVKNVFFFIRKKDKCIVSVNTLFREKICDTLPSVHLFILLLKIIQFWIEIVKKCTIKKIRKNFYKETKYSIFCQFSERKIFSKIFHRNFFWKFLFQKQFLQKKDYLLKNTFLISFYIKKYIKN